MIGPAKLSKVLGLKISEDLRGPVGSKSHKLFAELGLIRISHGLGTLSPFLMRSLRKLENLIHKKMEEISALEIQLPSLTDIQLLEVSGRADLPDLFRLNKKHGKSYFLNPTCEESITELLASSNNLTHKQLPCRLYQITNKFRDEKRPKSGLIRSREFIMKDLYCFDADTKSCQISYNEIKQKYHDLFQNLQVPYVCVKGTEGTIGGLESNEFHFLTEAGDDNLVLCQDCDHKEHLDCINQSDKTAETNEQSCPNCGGKSISIVKGIEVGHTFNLGTRYTKPFEATYRDKKGYQELLHMSCFGLGLTRIIAASAELMSSDRNLRWPLQIVPYLLCFVPPKAGSIEDKAAGSLTESLVHNLHELLGGEMIVDDRTSLTIGKRLNSIQALGIPYIVVLGKNVSDQPPLLEIHNVYESGMKLVPISDAVQCIRDILSNNLNSISKSRVETNPAN